MRLSILNLNIKVTNHGLCFHVCFNKGIAETPIVVTWVTFSPTNSTQVQYWLHGADPSTNTTAVGSSKIFVDHGEVKVVRYIH